MVGSWLHTVQLRTVKAGVAGSVALKPLFERNCLNRCSDVTSNASRNVQPVTCNPMGR